MLELWKQSEHKMNLVSEKWTDARRKSNNYRDRKNEEIQCQNKHTSDSKEMVIQELAMLQSSRKKSVKLLAGPPFLRSGRFFITWDI